MSIVLRKLEVWREKGKPFDTVAPVINDTFAIEEGTIIRMAAGPCFFLGQDEPVWFGFVEICEGPHDGVKAVPSDFTFPAGAHLFKGLK